MAIDSESSHCLAVTQGAIDGRGQLRGDGAVLVLDTRRGMVERSVAVGASPRAIVLDERRQRALVVNTNLNPDGSFVHLPTPQASWLQRIPWLGERLPWLVRPSTSADGRGRITVLDLLRLYR